MNNLKTRKLLSCASIILLLFTSTAGIAQVQTPRYISTGANSNGFYEYLPQGYNSGNQTYPLIIFLQGIGEMGDGSASQLPRLLNTGVPQIINNGQFPVSVTVNGVTKSFIVISPQFIAWPSPTDVDAVLTYATQHYRVDLSRIYVTGLSMGGGATWEYVGNNSGFANKVAAIVPIAGASWPEPTRARIIAAANIAVWAFHNDGDPTVPVSYTVDYVNNINLPPAPVPPAKKTIFANVAVHDAWTNVYNSSYKENNMTVWQWMLQYSRGSIGPSNLPPVANAGNPQSITLPTSSVQLNGSGSDADGTVASYAWSQVSGPSTPGFSNASITNPTVNNLVAGTYVFRLTVTDNLGATGTNDVIISVSQGGAGGPPSSSFHVESENYSTMSGVQTEATQDAGGGLDVGWIDTGDWMDYSINPSTAGTYTVSFRVASPHSGGQFQVLSGGNVLATVTVPNTGFYQTFQNASANVNLAAGLQTIRILITNSAGGFNMNYMDFGLQSGITPPPSGGSSFHVEAENYSATSGSNTENCSDAGGGKDIGWTHWQGDWTDYSINPSAAGSYNVSFRVASPNANGQFQLKTSSGAVLATVNVPGTGGFQAWQTVTASINLAAGQQTIRLYTLYAAGGWNINYMDFSSGNVTPPTGNFHVEAENFSATSGSNTENCSDAGGGKDIGWTHWQGDWTDYSINPTSTATYTVSFRVASPNANGQFQLKTSSGTVLATVNVPNTGGFQTWQTVTTSINLSAGQQTIRLYTLYAAGGWNINYMDFATGPIVSPPPSSFHVEAENYASMSGVNIENTSDAGGGKDIGWSHWTGDYSDYSINPASSATYSVSLRIASPNAKGQLQFRNSDGTVLATVNIPNTGGFQNWQTISTTVSLAAGQQTIRLYALNADGGWNINYMDFATGSGLTGNSASLSQNASAANQAGASLQVNPNPVTDRFVLQVNNAYTGNMNVQVTDMNGAVQKQFVVTKSQTGSTQTYLSIGDLSAGNYILTVQMAQWSSSTKVIKQ